ncbi:MAG: universal stress protein [Actinomycetes bacterium]
MSDAVIVVGIDGSEGSRRALRWALEEGVRRNCAVEAVTAWPSRDTRGHEHGELPDEKGAEARRSADEKLRHIVDTEVRAVDSPPPVSFEVVQGQAVDVLLRMSSSAALLVVGSHGTSSILHEALGSVSEACGRLAQCPVVVLPPPARPQQGSIHNEVARPARSASQRDTAED